MGLTNTPKFAGISIMTTSSRMVYAFARDGGLPASKYLARVHGKLVVPLNALIFTAVLVIIFGCIFLGSGKSGCRSKVLNGLLGRKEYPRVSRDINLEGRTENSRPCRHSYAPLYFPGSTSAYNAVVSASVVALGVTYAIPPTINCLRGRKMLPANRPFILPSWLGWACNLVFDEL